MKSVYNVKSVKPLNRSAKLRNNITLGPVLSALPWLLFAFICLSGAVRFAFPAAIALMYFVIIALVRRAETFQRI